MDYYRIKVASLWIENAYESLGTIILGPEDKVLNIQLDRLEPITNFLIASGFPYQVFRITTEITQIAEVSTLTAGK